VGKDKNESEGKAMRRGGRGEGPSEKTLKTEVEGRGERGKDKDRGRRSNVDPGMLHQITVHKPNFVVYTGDSPAHDLWLQTHELNVGAILNVTKWTLENTPNTTKYFPALGNHAGAPGTFFLNFFSWFGPSLLFCACFLFPCFPFVF
jgi:hypothetical protein